MTDSLQPVEHSKSLANSQDAAKPPASLEDLHTTFIRNVSHELRTPLSVLKGYAELLNTGELGPLASEQQEAMFLIVNRAEELETIVNRIGTLLAVQSGMAIPQTLSLSALVAQMIEVERFKAKEAGITLNVHLAPDLPLISGDAQQLQDAIECLVENALKFTPNGGQVEVSVHAEESDWISLTVTDTGIGMSEGELSQLATPFSQGDGSTTRRFGGLGLGLTVVYQVVAGHNGRIEVASKPGEGSRFSIKLPALPSAADEHSFGDVDSQIRRILVVDDEEFVAFTLQEGLERLPDCEVVVTNSPHEALRLFKEKPFDLLITDYKMPDMNGVALAAQIRKMSPKTGIIMVTAYSSHLLRETSAVSTFQRVLDKPVRLSEIRNAALETLDGKVEDVTG